MCMGSSARPSLVNIADQLKDIYGLQNLEAYTKNLIMNAEAQETDTSLIVADDYTIYGMFNMLKTGNSLSYVEFILMDRHRSETRISSADAGITRENASANITTAETAESTDPLVNIQPAEFYSTTFGYAFDWGASYDTVLDFVCQISGYIMENESSFIRLHTPDNYGAPEDYRFEFSDGKLTTVTGKFFSMKLNNYAIPDLVKFANALKDTYGLNQFGSYTKSDIMNAKTGEAQTSFIVADDYTIYGMFNMVKTGTTLSYVEFILTDKNLSETGISSAAAGITRENASGSAVEPAENGTETAAPAASGDATQVGTCKYGTHLAIGDKAEIVNTQALRMYKSSTTDYPIEGLNAFPGKEFTIIDGPACVKGVVWWKINFLGYIGWATEMNSDGLYYMEKR